MNMSTPHDRHYPVEGGAAHKYIHKRGYHKAYEGVEEEVAELGEVVRREIAVHAHGAESGGRDKECLYDGGRTIGIEYGAKCQTVDHGKQVEQQRGCA